MQERQGGHEFGIFKTRKSASMARMQRKGGSSRLGGCQGRDPVNHDQSILRSHGNLSHRKSHLSSKNLRCDSVLRNSFIQPIN